MEGNLLGKIVAGLLVFASSAEAGIVALFEDLAFDTAYTGASFDSLAPPSVQSGGPTGNYYQLQPDGVGLLSNTLDFASGGANLSALRAEFDFRMTAGDDKGEGFGFSIYSISAYAGFSPPADFTQADIDGNIVTWEQPRWNAALSLGFDLVDGAFDSEKNMVSLNADGRRVAAKILGNDLNSGAFNRVILDLENAGDDALASLTMVWDVHGASPVTESLLTDELIAGYFIPGSLGGAGDPVDWSAAFGGRTLGSTVGVDLDNIRIGAIPEPSSALLLAVAATAAAFRRRR